jgi:selenocysteine lyase/cysteine desulfurase
MNDLRPGDVVARRKGPVMTEQIQRRDGAALVAETRDLFARMIGARAHDIALCPSASFGLSTAAANLPVGPGRRVLILEGQFPSNVYPWQEAARAGGGTVEIVPRPASPDIDWTDLVLERLDDGVAVAALPQCHWVDGVEIDLVRIGARCRAVGAALVLDLSQSLGARPFDVAAVQPDFLVTVAEKWMFGPYRLAYLYAAPHRQQGRPLDLNWCNRLGHADHARLVDYTDAFEPGAIRYDMGGRADFVALPQALAGLRQLLEWGPAAISATLAPMVDEIALRGEALGLTAPPAAFRAPHFLGLRAASGLPKGLAEGLAARGVHVSVRDDAIRVAPNVYNDRSDIDRLFTALEDLLG